MTVSYDILHAFHNCEGNGNSIPFFASSCRSFCTTATDEELVRVLHVTRDYVEVGSGLTPSRGKGDEERSNAEGDCRRRLHRQSDAPLGVSDGKRAPVADPVGKAKPGSDSHALQTDDESALFRWRDLGDVNRDHTEQHAAAISSDKASGNHHSHVDCSCLQDSPDDSYGPCQYGIVLLSTLHARERPMRITYLKTLRG